MAFLRVVLLSVAYFSYVVADNVSQGTPVAKASESHPVYQPQESADYIPHATYPYADMYGPRIPYQPGYTQSAVSSVNPTNGYYSIIPNSVGILSSALRVFAKVGLFLLGGIALLVVGGVFTTAVCSLTPICTIQFAGIGGLDKEAMRSMLNPEFLASTAAMVESAVNKYQRMQESTRQ